ncbi:HAMP domain-containing sensor histidine kinase [Halpernia frigidisoli]|uniref:histidine kinase n=1 Tax=Halpernia frigidisoli TaxID=1125876 RepID=A0A1I3HQE1_9FLAO|nr:ATP-binding protein [Halpernia frigidisoli]SFI37750.1 PAS domain S-box-containing protein [Halpernia frigidisoli]
MKIKTKLNAGVGLLFIMIIGLSVLSGWYINLLKKDTNNILAANYNTLQYSRNMLLALEDMQTDPLAFDLFSKHLEKQRANVTEPGEGEATEKIAVHFNALKSDPKNTELQSSIRKDIAEVMQLNMSAIEHKSSIANTTAGGAITVISIAGTFCFLVAFILLVNLPSNIANPIKVLTQSIKEIANQNYKQRIDFEGNSEFSELSRSFNTMAEKLQEFSESKLDKIIKGKKRMETLIDNLHDPVIGIDENKKVLFVNDEALKITGLERRNFVGQLIQDVAVSNDLVRTIIREIINKQESKSLKDPMKIFANGKESYFEKEIVDINVIPTGEAESSFIGQVIMLRNITPFKELDLAKTNFMGTVSHEFKTPISSIKMGIQLLGNEKIGTLNEEQKNLISGVQDDADRLLKITSELLNIAQVESGSMKLNMQNTEIQDIIDYAMDANKSAADQKNIQVFVKKDAELNSVYADKDKTSWVLNNLLSNAVRYSYENSSIEINIKKQDNSIKFSVIDTGQGIDPAYTERVFDRYFRIPGNKKEGNGLGLSISKEFIEAQGGSITVKSEFGAGSEFSFVLNNGKI